MNWRAGRVVQGGSTITQQLAKLAFLTPARTLERKVQEMLLAFWLELRFEKSEILASYLNRAYFGAGAYGIATAARRYFGTTPARLNLAPVGRAGGFAAGAVAPGPDPASGPRPRPRRRGAAGHGGVGAGSRRRTRRLLVSDRRE